MLYFRTDAVVTSGGYDSKVNAFPLRCRPHFSVDPRTAAMAQWNWFYAINSIAPYSTIKDDFSLKHRFTAAFRRIKAQSLERAFIFGTGPSLELAWAADFSSGYRIVCNTIVCDERLYQKLNPHIIVAGDALYHFGDSRHACRFRRDLVARMQSSEAIFLYPEVFRPRVESDCAAVIDRCFPIGGSERIDFTEQIADSVSFPAIGNVLGYMLIPVGCSLSRSVFLLGFDGRRPSDVDFWKNAPNIAFPDLIAEMKTEYPAFYNNYVPVSDPNRYVNAVHGHELSTALDHARLKGWSFTMLSPSSSPALSSLPLRNIASLVERR
jgi:hypothetical protein